MQRLRYRGVRGWVVGTLLGISGLVLSSGLSQAGMTDDLMDTTKHPVSVTMAMQADSAVPVAAGEEIVAADVSVVWEIR